MRKDLIIVSLIAIGIAWAAWMDYRRVDPLWKKDPCHEGISYSVHQRESDERWVIGIRNMYVQRVVVRWKASWNGGEYPQQALLRKGEVGYYFLPGEQPGAKIEGLALASEDGQIIGELACD